VLNAAPFNLPWGSQVYAYVIAFNVYGPSGKSPTGSGAYMYTLPDPPTNIQEILSARTLTTIGFNWQ